MTRGKQDWFHNVETLINKDFYRLQLWLYAFLHPPIVELDYSKDEVTMYSMELLRSKIQISYPNLKNATDVDLKFANRNHHYLLENVMDHSPSLLFLFPNSTGMTGFYFVEFTLHFAHYYKANLEFHEVNNEEISSHQLTHTQDLKRMRY